MVVGWSPMVVRFQEGSIAFVSCNLEKQVEEGGGPPAPVRPRCPRARKPRRARGRRSGAVAALRSTDLSTNSPFSNPEFGISGQMVGHKVKPVFRHQFHT